jgi:spore germination protein GerM
MAIKFWQIKEVVFTAVAIIFAQSLVAAQPLRSAAVPAPIEPQLTAYWIAIGSPFTRLSPQTLPATPQQSKTVLLASAFGQLLSRSPAVAQQSSIPPLTKLLSLQVRSNGIYVDLSRDFLQGGGSASMINRLSQVVYTATSLDPTASVYLSVDGQPLTENTPMAGEGLVVSYPIDRQQLATDFPHY